MDQVKILNASIDNISQQRLLENLRYGGSVFTLNVDHLMKLQKYPKFYQAYVSATYRVCDSQVLKLLSPVIAQPIQEKISGSDFFPSYIDFFKSDSDVTLFLLGAAPGVAARVKDKINDLAQRTMVVDVYSPPFGFENDPTECQEIIDRINRSEATSLIVGLGAPKQEVFIYEHRHLLTHAKVFLAVGAALDFEAGQKERSPQWVSKAGLEWLHRLVTEPRRLWKRYLVESLPLLWLIPQQLLKLYKTPEFTTSLPSLSGLTPRQTCNLLEKAGLITARQLEFAMAQQERSPALTLDEILVEGGILTRKTLEFFTRNLYQYAADMRKYPLGHYLVSAGILSEAQLQSLLQEQKSVNLRLGELTVRHGLATEKTIDFFLEYIAPGCEYLPYEVFSDFSEPQLTTTRGT